MGEWERREGASWSSPLPLCWLGQCYTFLYQGQVINQSIPQHDNNLNLQVRFRVWIFNTRSKLIHPSVEVSNRCESGSNLLSVMAVASATHHTPHHLPSRSTTLDTILLMVEEMSTWTWSWDSATYEPIDCSSAMWWCYYQRCIVTSIYITITNIQPLRALVLEFSVHQYLTQTRHKPCSSLNARNLLGFSNATMALAIYVLMHLYTYSSKQCIISAQATYFNPSCSRVNQPSRKPILEFKWWPYEKTLIDVERHNVMVVFWLLQTAYVMYNRRHTCFNPIQLIIFLVNYSVLSF